MTSSSRRGRLGTTANELRKEHIAVVETGLKQKEARYTAAAVCLPQVPRRSNLLDPARATCHGVKLCTALDAQQRSLALAASNLMQALDWC